MKQHWGGPENEGNQQDVNEPQNCILAVSDDGVPGIEVVFTDLNLSVRVMQFCVQCVWTEEKPNYWIKNHIVMGKISILAPIMYNCHIEICKWAFSGLCGTLENVNLTVDGLVCFPSIRKIRGQGYVLQICIVEKPVINWTEDLVIFPEQLGNS